MSLIKLPKDILIKILIEQNESVWKLSIISDRQECFYKAKTIEDVINFISKDEKSLKLIYEGFKNSYEISRKFFIKNEKIGFRQFPIFQEHDYEIIKIENLYEFMKNNLIEILNSYWSYSYYPKNIRLDQITIINT